MIFRKQTPCILNFILQKSPVNDQLNRFLFIVFHFYATLFLL